MINIDNVKSCNDMTNTILLKMQEKEKKTDKKPASAATKGLRRNKTTVNLARNKKETKEKSGDNKLRKSTVVKNTGTDNIKPKLTNMSMKTEPNEKKVDKKESTIKKGDKKEDKKDNNSKTLAKSMMKSKTVARLSPKRNKKNLTPTKKDKKEEKKKENFKTETSKLSKLMARDMKSSLNPPELLKKTDKKPASAATKGLRRNKKWKRVYKKI